MYTEDLFHYFNLTTVTKRFSKLLALKWKGVDSRQGQ